DGGVLTGEHALKLMLLGADRVGFGTAVLMSIGCSMLRQCHLAGPQPGDATGKRRQGCTLGGATQDPALVARFTGKSRHVTRLLRHVAHELRELMAANGIRRLRDRGGGRAPLRYGDAGLPKGRLVFRHRGAAGHFYGAYAVSGMELYLQGLAADSCFTAAYGGKLVVVPEGGDTRLTVVGNTFGYGARAGRAYLAGRGGNRFGICMRKSHEGTGPRVVVEGVEATGVQDMRGGGG